MWKSGKWRERAKESASTGMWKIFAGFPRRAARKKFSPAGAEFSTGNVEKRHAEKKLVFGVDIGCDSLHGLGKSGAFVHLFFHLFNRMHYGGTMAVFFSLIPSTDK